MSILACILSAVAAICVYACVAHIFAARHQWFRSVHLIFAALSLMAAVHAISHIAVYSAMDVQAYVVASRYSNLSGSIIMALIPWLVQGYFAAGKRLAPALMSGFYVLTGVVYELATIGSTSRPAPLLEQIVLPWGESATIHRLPNAPLALPIFWAITSLLLIYLATLCARRQHGRRLQAVAMIISISALIVALGINTLVLAGAIDSIFVGEFGFLTLVLTMMRLLSGEESYRAIVTQAPAGIFMLSASGRFLDANRMGSSMLGHTNAELRKLTFRDVVAGPLSPPAHGGPTDLNGVYGGMRQLRRKDGTILLVDISCQQLSDGRTLSIAQNVTEARRVDSLLQLLAEAGPAADATDFIARFTKALAEAFGVSHAAVGVLDERSHTVDVLGSWPATECDAVRRYEAQHAPCVQLSAERQSVFIPNPGAQFPSHARFASAASGAYLGAAILNSAGGVVGVVEIWDEKPFVAGPRSHRLLETFAHRLGAEFERTAADRELRELTATLEARVAARTAQLAQANKELEAFSYSVSHDLRAPVRAIDAHANMMLQGAGAGLDSAARRHLDRIAQATRRMRELIDGLLTLARLSHQAQTIESVDLSALAEQAMELLQERDRAHRVSFVCEPGLLASADRTGANVVLTNLLENAWKYSSRVEARRIEFGAEHRDTETVYFVRDNGVGFDMQHAQHLFTAFWRLHTNDEYPGSGIGLATVERIVQRHGGRIWAESSPGQGATFYFTLKSPEPARVAGNPQQAPARGAESQRINADA